MEHLRIIIFVQYIFLISRLTLASSFTLSFISRSEIHSEFRVQSPGFGLRLIQALPEEWRVHAQSKTTQRTATDNRIERMLCEKVTIQLRG